MASFSNGGTRSFIALETIPQYARVKFIDDPQQQIQGGGVAIATDGEVGIGTAQYQVERQEGLSVRFTNSSGTHIAIAQGTISLNEKLYAAPNGKVANTGTAALGAIALDSDQDEGYIEILYL